MKIKLLKTATLIGTSLAVQRGTVVESEDGVCITEFKALVSVGYAKVTTEPATLNLTTGKKQPPISGVREAPSNKVIESAPEHKDDPALKEILTGNAKEVEAALDSLDADQLARLATLEAAGDKRKGVAADIAAALNKLQG